MQVNALRGRRSLRRLVAIGIAGVMMLGGPSVGALERAGSSGGGAGAAHGVAPKTIKVGILLIDYDSIKDFVDFYRGDQQAIAQYSVDDINANGGVLGRKIKAVYKKYPPIPGREPSPLSLCTSLTEDEKVFAVIGVFIDFTGDGQLCVARDHKTIHIGYELEQAWIDQAPPGLMLTPDGTKERAAATFIELLGQKRLLEGRKVAVLGDQSVEQRIGKIIEPGLDHLHLKRGSTAVLTIAGGDTSGALAQLDGFIERWKQEKVNTIFLSGATVSSKAFVGRIKNAMPKALLVSDSSASAGLQAADEVAAGADPNPYEGALSIVDQTTPDRFKHPTPILRHCMDVYEKRSGKRLLAPDKVKPDADGRTQQIFLAVVEFCSPLYMLKSIAERAGKDLTNKTWQTAVDNYGPITVAAHAFASLCKGKYAAADGAQLAAWDSKFGTTGGWRPRTKLIDASGGQCTKDATKGP